MPDHKVIEVVEVKEVSYNEFITACCAKSDIEFIKLDSNNLPKDFWNEVINLIL